MAYYVVSDDKCFYEGMTKEQILAAITQAVESHEIHDVDTGFVTKLKEANKNKQLSFWVGTTAEYNAIDPKVENCFYILTDDTELEDLETQIQRLSNQNALSDAYLTLDLSALISTLKRSSATTSFGLKFQLAFDPTVTQYSSIQVDTSGNVSFVGDTTLAVATASGWLSANYKYISINSSQISYRDLLIVKQIGTITLDLIGVEWLYTVTVNSTLNENTQLDTLSANVCVKVGSRPTSAGDYTYYIGSASPYDSFPASFEAKKIYVWGGADIEVEAGNSFSYSIEGGASGSVDVGEGGTSYQNAQEIVLTGDAEITVSSTRYNPDSD